MPVPVTAPVKLRKSLPVAPLTVPKFTKSPLMSAAPDAVTTSPTANVIPLELVRLPPVLTVVSAPRLAVLASRRMTAFPPIFRVPAKLKPLTDVDFPIVSELLAVMTLADVPLISAARTPLPEKFPASVREPLVRLPPSNVNVAPLAICVAPAITRC